METVSDSGPRDRFQGYSNKGETSGNETYDGYGGPLVIIIFAVSFHVLIIIIAIYFACCRKSNRSFDMRNLRSFDRYSSVRRSSGATTLEGSRRDRDRHESRSSSVRDNHGRPSLSTGSMSSLRTQAELEIRPTDADLRPVTSWQTSLLTRVRGHLGLLPRQTASQSPPPPYRVRVEADDNGGGGLTNLAIDLEEEHELPSYDDYLHTRPAWYRGTGVEFDGEKPPPYEDVVKTQSDH